MNQPLLYTKPEHLCFLLKLLLITTMPPASSPVSGAWPYILAKLKVETSREAAAVEATSWEATSLLEACMLATKAEASVTTSKEGLENLVWINVRWKKDEKIGLSLTLLYSPYYCCYHKDTSHPGIHYCR